MIEIELLPGEFFKGITIGCEHLYTLLHPVNFFIVHPYLLLLAPDLDAGLYPADYIGSWLEYHHKDEHGSGDCREFEETAVRTVEYFTRPCHFLPSDVIFCTKIAIFERFLSRFSAKNIEQLYKTLKHNKMKPTLLVLAAGMGSRYGGLKQMDGLGPNGETIIDYSIYDAVQSGFGKVVYVVRNSFRDQFEQLVKEKYSHVKCTDGTPLQFEFVIQELNKIPAGYTLNPERQKPWGTAHAVLMAKDVIKEPFAVINGDDYYGKESFKILADWLRAHENSTGRYCMVGFELDHTLSESGGVSRGICKADADHILTHVEEHHNIAKAEDGKVYGDNSKGEKVELDGKALASMNMWGFTPDYFEKSGKIFEDFIAKNINELKAEFYIPYAIDCMIKEDSAKTELLSTPSHWFGVTFKEDRPGVVAKFQEFADKGVYPTPLYNK